MNDSIAKKIFSGYPDVLKKIMVESDSYNGIHHDEAYYNNSLKRFGVYPNCYVGKNFNDVLGRIACEYSPNIKVLGFTNTKYTRLKINTESYEFSSEVLDRGVACISLDVNGYKITLCYTAGYMNENAQYSQYDIIRARQYNEIFKSYYDELKSVSPDELKELTIRDFVDMCRGKNV